MTGEEIDAINKSYWSYCENDGRKSIHLPFIIWLKQVAKIDPKDYYGDDENNMLVEDIQELSTRAKNSLIRNGYITLKDIYKANFYDIFALPCFKRTVKNMKIILKVMHENGYPNWGLTPLLYDKTVKVTYEVKE